MTYVLPLVSGLDFTPPKKHVWQDDAACEDDDVEIYFSGDRNSVEKAKSACEVCEVVMDCLKFAAGIEGEHTTYGVYGGLTANQRKKMYRLRREDPSLTLEDAYEIVKTTKVKKKTSQDLQAL